MKKSYLKILVLILVFSLFLGGWLVSTRTSEKLDYVALGDSLAAGYTPNSMIDKSYPDFIAEKLDGEGTLGDYKNFGVPGYTTLEVLADINLDNPDNADRIAAISNAELITVDVGANDLLNSIFTLIADPSQVPAAIQNVAGNIAQITRTLKDINPNAKIYLMGYYNAFPYYPEEQQKQVIPLIIEFNKAVKGAATSTGATYVDTYTTMDKHLANYLPEADIHPNILGYQAIAKDFWAIIKVDFLREKNSKILSIF